MCAHGGDHALITGGGLLAGYDEAHKLPDLFAPDLARFPQLTRCRLYRGTQHAGEVVFNPSRCVHAVRNSTMTVSVRAVGSHVTECNDKYDV